MLGLAAPCFGSTIAIRKQTLAAIGGLEAVADQLADDYALGAAVRRAGFSIAIPAYVVGHECTQSISARSSCATSCAGRAPSARWTRRALPEPSSRMLCRWPCSGFCWAV